MHEKKVLEVKELSLKDSNQILLSDLSFNVYQNEILAIVGESGSGKSITCLSLAQLLPEHLQKKLRGKAILNENIDLLSIDNHQIRSIRGSKIAYIFQEPMTALNPVIKCGEQITEAIQLHQYLSKKDAKALSIKWISNVQLPDPYITYHKYPHELSGGQRQRIMIAMALACQPDLLICDEPTTALDVTVQKSILELLKALQANNGFSVLFISHDLGVVASIADRIMVMQKGQIVETESTNRLLSAPQHPYTQKLLSSSKLNIQINDNHIVECNNDYLIKVENLYFSYPNSSKTSNNSTSYTLLNINFHISHGELVGLVGESGSGKSTLSKLLIGLLKSSSGKIYYKNNSINDWLTNRYKDFKKQIQFVFQDPYAALNPRKTVGSAIEEVIQNFNPTYSKSTLKKYCIEFLNKVELEEAFYDKYPHQLSGGQRQRIVIARALATEPTLLICDESVAALDVTIQTQVLELLVQLQTQLGLTILFITHDLRIVQKITSRVLVLKAGELVEQGATETVFKNPSHPYTKQLLSAIPHLA